MDSWLLLPGDDNTSLCCVIQLLSYSHHIERTNQSHGHWGKLLLAGLPVLNLGASRLSGIHPTSILVLYFLIICGSLGRRRVRRPCF